MATLMLIAGLVALLALVGAVVWRDRRIARAREVLLAEMTACTASVSDNRLHAEAALTQVVLLCEQVIAAADRLDGSLAEARALIRVERARAIESIGAAGTELLTAIRRAARRA